MDVVDEKKSGRRERRTFSAEFKASAVALVIDEGHSVSKVARNLDVTYSGLRVWVEQALADRGKGGADVMSTSEKAELARLRKELREVKMERDILKKAAVFFAKASE